MALSLRSRTSECELTKVGETFILVMIEALHISSFLSIVLFTLNLSNGYINTISVQKLLKHTTQTVSKSECEV